MAQMCHIEGYMKLADSVWLSLYMRDYENKNTSRLLALAWAVLNFCFWDLWHFVFLYFTTPKTQEI
jgi:hypothetical protein